MQKEYITTNVRLPRFVYKDLKRRAFEEDKSLAQLIREIVLTKCINIPPIIEERKKKSWPKKVHSLVDLAKLAEPLGGDMSLNIDKIVYDENYH